MKRKSEFRSSSSQGDFHRILLDSFSSFRQEKMVCQLTSSQQLIYTDVVRCCCCCCRIKCRPICNSSIHAHDGSRPCSTRQSHRSRFRSLTKYFLQIFFHLRKPHRVFWSLRKPNRPWMKVWLWLWVQVVWTNKVLVFPCHWRREIKSCCLPMVAVKLNSIRKSTCCSGA